MVDLAGLRENYTKGGMEKTDLHVDPIAQFESWLSKAVEADLLEPNAMTLATSSRDGMVSTRTVLLKKLDHGFGFFSNYRSHKARDMEDNPQVALTFLWKELERQVNIRGRVEKMSREESAAYFRSRPLSSQIGAWVSEYQSRELLDRAEIEAKELALRTTFSEGEVPLPDFWGGYRVIPEVLEFWQGREGRLHDRLAYQRLENGIWSLARLSP